MQLSVLEQIPLFSGHTDASTLDDTVTLAKGVEEAGYKRFWVAEHHNTPHFLSSAPDLMMMHLLNHTSTIRVGSGGVMAMHYGSLQIAERFATLATLFPDRVDMGIGRAPGGDMTASAALNQGSVISPGAINQLILETVGLLNGTLPDNHPYAGITVAPSPEILPQVWLLGSSGQSAAWAGSQNFNYAYAQFFSGHQDTGILDYYRAHLPADHTSGGTLSALLVCAAATHEEAERMALSGLAARMSLALGQPLDFRAPEEFSPDEVERLQRFATREHSMIVGSYDEVAAAISDFSDSHHAEEIMLVSYLPQVQTKLEMYHELIARLA